MNRASAGRRQGGCHDRRAPSRQISSWLSGPGARAVWGRWSGPPVSPGTSVWGGQGWVSSSGPSGSGSPPYNSRGSSRALKRPQRWDIALSPSPQMPHIATPTHPAHGTTGPATRFSEARPEARAPSESQAPGRLYHESLGPETQAAPCPQQPPCLPWRPACRFFEKAPELTEAAHARRDGTQGGFRYPQTHPPRLSPRLGSLVGRASPCGRPKNAPKESQSYPPALRLCSLT